MSAPGWEMVEGGWGGRLRVHTLRAGVFWAKISEWADRGTACRLVLRIDYPDSSPGAYATAQTVASWCGDASDLEADKGRLEAEIRRLATEALAALGGAS